MDSIGLDTNPFIASGAPGVRGRASERARTLREACVREPAAESGFWARRRPANDGQTGPLRTVVRCAIIAVIAHLYLARITPVIPPPETRP